MDSIHREQKSVMLLDLEINNQFKFATEINTALSVAELELESISNQIADNLVNIKKLTSDCDKTDYILSACSGALCGLIDVFLVGKPGESPVGEITDKWFENRVMDFAKMCGWDRSKNDSLASAVRYLEKTFSIPYDQRGAGDNGSIIFDLSPGNHHFKSLGHNPTILGLFFSIMDQFSNTSHFVTEGQLISLQEADGSFELAGNNVPTKLFCGFMNWFGHLISDISGSSGSKSRGMGIPSPFWAWTNDVIAIKSSMGISVNEFDKSINELALTIYKKGYDARFQTAQMIPVFINEMLVRTIYSVRRLLCYYSSTKKKDRSYAALWAACEPFGNATVKRMLTVAHGTFCLVDAGDALARGFVTGGGSINVAECILRLNIVGIGRLTISLYGEGNRYLQKKKMVNNIHVLQREKSILTDYIHGLQYLSEIYDDSELLNLTKELQESELYIQAFGKSVKLAEKRSVPKEKILTNKDDIDSYFLGGKIR